VKSIEEERKVEKENRHKEISKRSEESKKG
jgi:hypothetical protein